MNIDKLETDGKISKVKLLHDCAGTLRTAAALKNSLDKSAASVTKKHQALQNGQHHQVRHAVPAAGGLGAKLRLTRLLMLRNGLELHLHTADGDTVFGLQRANLNLSAVDQRSVLGTGIRDRPAAVVVPGQDRMVPGHGGKVDGHVAGLAPADDVFPMGDGNLAAVGHVQPRPDLRLPPERQQGQDAAQKQYGAEHRHGIAKDSHIGACVISLRQRQRLENILHTITLLSSGNSYV